MIDKNTYNSVLSRVEKAKKKSKKEQKVEIVAVTKTHPRSFVLSAYKLGLRHIGENRVQEGQKKLEELQKTPLSGLTKRFIGHLQSNKVNKCLNYFDTVDSVHSFNLAKKISNRAETLGKIFPVLLEVKTSEEKTKSGFDIKNTEDMLLCAELPNIHVRGLMTMAPFTKDKGKKRHSFASLRVLFKELNKIKPQLNMSVLSMGMSSDFEIAIEEGSTMIRLGTVLFGKRNALSR